MKVPSWLERNFVNERQSSPRADASQPAAEWRNDGRTFRVTFDGEEYFAGYQFDARCQPLPVIREILQALGEVRDSWPLAAWFQYWNGWVSAADANVNQPVAPMDALDRPDALVEAARYMRGEYVA